MITIGADSPVFKLLAKDQSPRRADPPTALHVCLMTSALVFPGCVRGRRGCSYSGNPSRIQWYHSADLAIFADTGSTVYSTSPPGYINVTLDNSFTNNPAGGGGGLLNEPWQKGLLAGCLVLFAVVISCILWWYGPKGLGQCLGITAEDDENKPGAELRDVIVSGNENTVNTTVHNGTTVNYFHTVNHVYTVGRFMAAVVTTGGRNSRVREEIEMADLQSPGSSIPPSPPSLDCISVPPPRPLAPLCRTNTI